jgi:hypothetical protein
LKGLERETYEGFLADRHKKPLDVFVQRAEYERRAAAGELLMLSIAPPKNGRQSRGLILDRNWTACHLADAVFIGGAARKCKEWSCDRDGYIEKRQKTFALARRLLKTKIPAFTVDHEDNRELLDLGIPGLTPKTVGRYLETLGARKVKPKEPSSTRIEDAPQPRMEPPAVAASPGKPRVEQYELFDRSKRSAKAQ